SERSARIQLRLPPVPGSAADRPRALHLLQLYYPDDGGLRRHHRRNTDGPLAGHARGGHRAALPGHPDRAPGVDGDVLPPAPLRARAGRARPRSPGPRGGAQRARVVGVAVQSAYSMTERRRAMSHRIGVWLMRMLVALVLLVPLPALA